MSSTITLQTVVNWSSAFINYEVPTVGAGNEPSISNANIVLQSIMGPPFRWNWNRSTVFFSTIAGTQDYQVTTAPNMSFIESASVTLGASSYGIKEIKQDLTVGTEPGRPQSIATQIDNNAGVFTFRFLPVPDNSYTIAVTYQQKPALFTSLASTWAVPDQYSYIYYYGFLALTMAYDDDPRFAIFNQKFVAHLLGTQQGLTETERNLFIDTWNLIARQESLMGIKTQQGRAALGT